MLQEFFGYISDLAKFTWELKQVNINNDDALCNSELGTDSQINKLK